MAETKLCIKCGKPVPVLLLPVKVTSVNDSEQCSRYCPFCGALVWRTLRGTELPVEVRAEYRDPLEPVQA